MEGALIGRDALVALAEAALRDRGAVLLEGPAGIGKTSLSKVLVEDARRDGMLVLGCAPTEAERALPLAALADVLHPLAAHVATLPPPQREAIEAALLVSGGPVDERALAVATVALLAAVTREAPAGVLLVVDDAQWLDPPSERALRFALRRSPEGLAVLVSRRSGEHAAEAPLGLEEHAALTRVAVTPLGVGPLHHVLKRNFGVALGRPLVSRIARESGGNPLFAIELTRAVLRLPERPRAGEDLPVPRSMHDLVAASLAGLPASSLVGIRLAALLATPDLATLAAAGVAATDLDAAEEAGLIHVDDDHRVRFRHPVHAAAVRAGIPQGVRRRLHARLAAASTDPDERARQLVRSATRGAGAVATELADAATRARERGGPELAADLFERAADLTSSAAAHRWRLAAVRCRFDSGDYAAAAAGAAELAASAAGDDLAEALLLRSTIAFSADADADAIEAAEQALTAATPGTRLAGRIHAHLAVFVDLPDAARGHAEAALALLSDPRAEPDAGGSSLVGDDRSLLTAALMLLFLNEVRSGARPRLEILDQALELEDGRPSWLCGTIPAIWWKSIDEPDRAVTRLSQLLELATAVGEEPWQHEIIAHLGETLTLAGRFTDAATWIARARELGEQLATGLASETWLAGMLDAHVGATAAASAAAEQGLRDAERIGVPWGRRINLQLAAFAALAAGRSADAAARYAELAEALDATGLVEPLATRFEGDWVEACLDSGDLPTADLALARLELRHARLPRPWTTLALARSRVLIAASRGADTTALIDALLAARDEVPAVALPFDRARCLLVAGLAHRRARRRGAARDLLLQAAAEFDALGAAGFAARARADAARTGERRRDPAALTSTEREVAELAAAGSTNRAIADTLFISPKTVEANLARVYRKLGIARRAELGAALAAQAFEA
ncbi:AAA family ATPase [Jatrophihabitans sp.]|uniref:helix-turn-helix transcriptional regulator n=1 Tax=Jatrophihabitans sp. TaxID=1932789 RepID=UPI0030C684B2|nr:LuxR family transcriptional regulator [Jatrophihabitans sp.]